MPTMKGNAPVDLFVYGTLAYDRTMRALTGRIFPKRPCVLKGYTRVMPPCGYSYIIPDKGGAVNGYLVEGLTRRHLARLDAYEAEGDMYHRRRVTVARAGKNRPAYAYVANRDRIERHFGGGEETGARDASVIVDEIIEEEAARASGKRPSRETMTAYRELLDETVEELRTARRGGKPLPREEMRRALRTPGIPTLAPLKKTDHPARPYAGAYLRFVVRHIVFSHIEERIAARFRDLVAQPVTFYSRARSAFAALASVNEKKDEIEESIEREGCGSLRDDWDYLEYALRGLRIASRVFDACNAAGACRLARRDAQPGAIPLGAELEFSNLGARAIGAAPGQDPEFDGFYYVRDFDLIRRGWKLGLHVDNHRAVCAPGERCRGFLEYALGRWRIAADLSRPVTNDPCLLAGLVREAAAFCGIPAHSLHLSLEIPPGRPYGPVEQPSDLLCLLLLGGDLRRDESGTMREMRIRNREIEDDRGGLYFSRENVHSSDGEMQSEVIEYQFPRLKTGHDFTPLIMALKGFQLAGNPHPVNPFMAGGDYRPDHPLLKELKRWAECPCPLPGAAIGRFLSRVEAGLNSELSGAPAHSPAFIRNSIESVARKLRDANDSLR
ncbi:MAG: gamma-glutamylcyclotransferase family protein [Chlamydiota bacterium]